MASEIKSESVQKPTVKSYLDVVKAGIQPSAAYTEKSSDKETRLTAEKPKVGHGVDWLHRLAEGKFVKLNSDIPWSVKYRFSTSTNVPVLWNGDVYMIESIDMWTTEEGTQCKLLKYSISSDSWSDYVIPCDKEEHWYDEQAHALTTYRSKLLLIDYSSRVWEFDANKSTFKPSPDITLPQNWRATHIKVAAASEDKYLVVIQKSQKRIYVNIFDGSTWVVCDAEYMCLCTKSNIQVIIHDHSVFLTEWLQTKCKCDHFHVIRTSLQSLIDNKRAPWQLLKSTLPMRSESYSVSNFFTLGRHLSLVSSYRYHQEFKVLHYLVDSENWLETGGTEIPLHSFVGQKVHAVGLPDESLIMIYYDEYERSETAVYRLKPESSYRKLQAYESTMTGKFMTRFETQETSPPSLYVSMEKELLEEKLMTLQPSRIKEEADTSSFKPLQQSKSEEILSGKNMGLPGVDVCGVTAVIVSNSSLEWQWEGYGLKIHISENTLPPGIEQCHINVNASLTGHYELPEDNHLVSAIFWFRCEPQCRFIKPIVVEIQHCACSHNISKLKFVKAVCTQVHRPYTFKESIGGSFNESSSFGIVELRTFSGIGITQEGSEERNYLANFLYKEEKIYSGLCFHLYFVVTWDTPVHRKVMMERFTGAKLCTDQLIVFESNYVKFKLSSNPDGNWIIKTMNSQIVEKKTIDSFAPGKTSWIPYSQFKAILSRKIMDDIPALECEVDLIGAKEPHNKFTVDIRPSPDDLATHKKYEDPKSKGLSDSAILKPNLRDLMRELKIKAADWEDLGVELQMEYGELKQIKQDNTNDSKSCLRELFGRWLTRISPEPSWTAIVEAVEHLGDEDLARKLKSKYVSMS